MQIKSIVVDHISKSFRLPHEKNNSIKAVFIGIFRRKRTYENQRVLKDITFDVREGEFLGIVGRNGSGKSTLLKTLAGIYSPDKGTISISGRLTPFIELGVGFNQDLTGRENVFLNGALLGFSRKEMLGMYQDIVEFAELEKFMDQKLKNYSSGMQVRLAFSIAIRANSEILILDEVLAVGDSSFQRKCYDYFMTLKSEGRTVVLVTHDMSAVRQYCTRAIMIEGGRIVEDGTPDKVAQAYQKLFLKNKDGKSHGKEALASDSWGSGMMEISSCELKQSKSELKLSARFTATEPVHDPIFGFTLYSPSGINILEGNTRREEIDTGSFSKGDSLRISWSIPNIFAPGSHSISVACCDSSATEFYEWKNRAAIFNVKGDVTTAGVVNPKVRIDQFEKRSDK